MKCARIADNNTVRYYAAPKPTRQKPNRWLILVGERKCWCRLTAWLRAKLYEII